MYLAAAFIVGVILGESGLLRRIGESLARKVENL